MGFDIRQNVGMVEVGHEFWMRQAIRAATEGIAAGQSPFGSAIVRGDELIAVGHNEVVSTPDPTAHAEVVTLRRAAKKLGTHDLAGCRIYSTCEPCSMCASAIHWSNLDELYFGAAIADAQGAGFREIELSPEQIYLKAASRIRVVSGILQPECAALFDEWLGKPDRVVY